MDAIDFALRVSESVAFSIHFVIGITEPCHGIMNALVEKSLPLPNYFFPAAALCLASVAVANFSSSTAVVLSAQAYIVAFHTGGVITHLRVDHHPASVVGPGFFVLLAFIVIALRTDILVAMLVTAVFAGVGTLLGRLLVRRKGWKQAPLIDDDQQRRGMVVGVTPTTRAMVL